MTYVDVVWILKGHWSRVNTATYSLDGKRIVTAGFDRTAGVWEAETGRPLAITGR